MVPSESDTVEIDRVGGGGAPLPPQATRRNELHIAVKNHEEFLMIPPA
jgi:hypothetical protein